MIDTTAEIETALIYSVVVDRHQLHAVRPIVSADDLTGSRRRLFAEICDLADTGGDHTDIVQLSKHLAGVGALRAVGGAAGLAALTETPAKSSNATAYARQVRKLADRRRFAKLLASASATLDDPQTDATDIMDRIIGDVSAMRSRSSTAASTTTIYEAGLAALAHVDSDNDDVGGVFSGIDVIDDAFGAFGNGTLTTIAARTSIGKSGLCLQMSHNIAADGGRVLYLSMEMPAIELAFRCLGADAGVCSQRIANRAITIAERERLLDALERMRGEGLTIDDRPNQTAGTIAAAARAAKSSAGLDALVIDHIGLVGFPSTQRRHEAIADASRSFKRLAKELSIPVFMACQINRRGDEQGQADRPRLSHLADSTSIEMDSDNVIILHRDRPSDALTTFAFEKVRNGGKGVRKMRMDLPSTWFVDAESPSRHDVRPHAEFADFS